MTKTGTTIPVFYLNNKEIKTTIVKNDRQRKNQKRPGWITR